MSKLELFTVQLLIQKAHGRSVHDNYGCGSYEEMSAQRDRLEKDGLPPAWHLAVVPLWDFEEVEWKIRKKKELLEQQDSRRFH